MLSRVSFDTNSLFKCLIFDDATGNWNFIFNDKIFAKAIGHWRLMDKHKVVAVSFDHQHQFGLHKPLDLIDVMNKKLKNLVLKKISVDADSGDLKLFINRNYEIQIPITSMGYESYEFCVNNVRYIGIGGDEDLRIINNK